MQIVDNCKTYAVGIIKLTAVRSMPQEQAMCADNNGIKKVSRRIPALDSGKMNCPYIVPWPQYKETV